MTKYDRKPEVMELVNNTTIIHREHTSNRLKIAEAVSIELQRPTLNIQTKFDLVLPSNRRRTVPHRRTEESEGRATEDLAPTQNPENQTPLRTSDEGPAPTQAQESNIRGGGRRQLRNLPLRNYQE